MTKLLTLYSPNSCNSFFFLTPLPTTPHTSFPLPASSLSGICTCCSPAMTCCPWRTGFSTRRLTHCQSSTWETSPCPAASPLSGKRAGTFFVHHGTRGLFACLPRKTHPRTPDKLTIQTLNWFLTETINPGGGERPLQSERTCYFTRSTSMFYSLTLSICLLCSNLKDGGCAAQPRVWLESTLFTEGQSSKPEAWLAFFCSHF